MLPIPTRHLMLTLRWGVALLLLAHHAGADYYIYKEKDNTNWDTDRQLPSDQYTLIATVGRPMAATSCAGVTQAIMEQRASIHAPVIEQYEHIYGVDARLIKAIISVESCFDRDAVSRVGVKGLMQLMPETAHARVSITCSMPTTTCAAASATSVRC
jgi:soluble lytic murein transglycosylase-like protein